MTEVSAGLAATVLVMIALHQAALAFGAPIAEPALDAPVAKDDRRPSTRYRFVSAASALLILLAAGVVAASSGAAPNGGLDERVLTWTTWTVAGYLLINALTDLASVSAAKRWLGSTTKTGAAILCAVVAAQPA